MQCVGGLYLTEADLLAPLLINNSENNFFLAISTCGKQKRSSQIFHKISGVFQQDFNGIENSAVLEPRDRAIFEDLRLRDQGLDL